MTNNNAETTLFTNGTVTVTNARFVVPEQTYAMSGVTSVKLETKKPNRLLPLALMLGGFVAAKSIAGASIWHFLMLLLPGLLVLIAQRTKYLVTLSSASGESRPLASKNATFVRQVVDALNAAIIMRG